MYRPLPAHAGVSRPLLLWVSRPQTAPRPRGGQSAVGGAAGAARNRSPPTRGSVDILEVVLGRPVPLPAHAGVSRRSGNIRPDHRAAPRPRGGQSMSPTGRISELFRSPPTRGSVATLRTYGRGWLPLPAHAGVSRCYSHRRIAAHPAPRPRGGQSSQRARYVSTQPRSPPTRGSVDRAAPRCDAAAPHPAHAGVSRNTRTTTGTHQPAPRPRGGQSMFGGVWRVVSGRSPPTRGSVVGI